MKAESDFIFRGMNENDETYFFFCLLIIVWKRKIHCFGNKIHFYNNTRIMRIGMFWKWKFTWQPSLGVNHTLYIRNWANNSLFHFTYRHPAFFRICLTVYAAFEWGKNHSQEMFVVFFVRFWEAANAVSKHGGVTIYGQPVSKLFIKFHRWVEFFEMECIFRSAFNIFYQFLPQPILWDSCFFSERYEKIQENA